MNPRRRILELLVLGSCAFVLTQAILSQVLAPGDTPTEGSAISQLILSLCYLSVAGVLVPYYRETLYVLRRNWVLVALVFLALVSVSWAPIPAFALRRAIAALGTTLFGITLAVRLSLVEQLRLLSWLCRTIAVLSLACVILLPSYGISATPEHQWQGVFGYKSVLGFVMALSILVEWQLPTPTTFSRTLNRLALVLSAVLLFFASSLTPTLALLWSLLLVEVYKFAVQRLRISQAVTVLAMLVMVWSGVAIFLTNGERITNALGRSSDLTGRTEIWSWVADSILERPLLGHGYSGFWSGVSAASAGLDQAAGGVVMYAHNGYLEVLLNLGIVGFALTLAFLGAGIRRASYWFDRNPRSVRLWPLAFMLFFLFQNFAECTILLQDLEWAICVAVVASTDRALLAAYEDEDEDDEELFLEPSEQTT
jgi:exopolysaccharide production protein ExoQ